MSNKPPDLGLRALEEPLKVALVKAASDVMGSPLSVLILTCGIHFSVPAFSTHKPSRNLASTLLESWIGRRREYRKDSRNYR